VFASAIEGVEGGAGVVVCEGVEGREEGALDLRAGEGGPGEGEVGEVEGVRVAEGDGLGGEGARGLDVALGSGEGEGLDGGRAVAAGQGEGSAEQGGMEIVLGGDDADDALDGVRACGGDVGGEGAGGAGFFEDVGAEQEGGGVLAPGGSEPTEEQGAAAVGGVGWREALGGQGGALDVPLFEEGEGAALGDDGVGSAADAVEPDEGAARVVLGEVEVSEKDRSPDRGLAAARVADGTGEGVADLGGVVARAEPGLAEAEPDLRGPGDQLGKLSQELDREAILERLLRGVGGEEQADGGAGDLGQQFTGVVEGEGGVAGGEGTLGGEPIFRAAASHDDGATEEVGEFFLEGRHRKASIPQQAGAAPSGGGRRLR
jgi:hypothetical protein